MTGHPELVRLADRFASQGTLAQEARQGLARPPRALSPKWLYDARGSELFEEITRQPEYYLTETESELLHEAGDDLVALVRPRELVEVGSGSSRKTRQLLTALERRVAEPTYVAFDVSEPAVTAATAELDGDFPSLRVCGVVGDFDRHLEQVPRRGRRLVAVLGSTIGNMHPDEQVGFLRRLRGMLTDEDALLLGADLVKDPEVLEAAYNDAAGVTDAFTFNILHVLRRQLGAEIDLDAFAPFARWEPEPAWMRLGLRAVRETLLAVPDVGLAVTLGGGEEIRTELSCKYTHASLRGLLHAAGLELVEWRTDRRQWFGLALARPQPIT